MSLRSATSTASGQKHNYPITKFGKISILSSERWFFSPEWHRQEQAYVVELQNTPGLSGAPVMVYGPEFRFTPFQFRELTPLVEYDRSGGEYF
jgi:hypothetical protein